MCSYSRKRKRLSCIGRCSLVLTIRDVAKYCNVSTATVSKAFSSDSDISYETTERVRAAARALGYYPSAAARSLKTQHACNLGVLAQLNHPNGIYTEFVTRVINAFQTEAERNGYDLTFVSKSLSGKTMSYEEHCLYRNFDGVAVICADFFSPQIQALLDKDQPSVTVDYAGDRHASVITDTQAAYDEMADFVYRRGHRRIAVIRDDSTVIADLRYQCLRKAFDARGLELADGRTFAATFNQVDAAAHATEEILSLSRIPSCIFYPDDIACIGGINTLRQRGYSVPGDVSVVGFDGIQLSQVIQPHLTTYRQDMETIGRTALQLLLTVIENPKGEKPHRLIPGEMLPGETVARV